MSRRIFYIQFYFYQYDSNIIYLTFYITDNMLFSINDLLVYPIHSHIHYSEL